MQIQQASNRLKMMLPLRFSTYLLHTLAGLIFFLLLLYALLMDTITVAVDGARMQLTTIAPTVKEALASAGVFLQPGDEVEPGLSTRISDGMEIKLRRGVKVFIHVDGKEIETRIPPVAVEEALLRTGIDLGIADRVSVPLTDLVWEGLRLKVTRVATETITVEEQIKPAVTYINDPNLDKGKQRVVNNGVPGVLAKEYAVVYENGAEVSRKQIGAQVVKPAVKKVIARGTRPVIRTASVARGRTIRYTDVLTMEATAYEPGPQSCGIYADGYTYTGKKATYGIAAVDPKVIPLGTKLYIEGYGFASAEDIGLAIKGNRIDVCYDTVREALLWGRKKVKVYILAP